MTIYKVQVTVHDGDNEYPFYEYVNAVSSEKARDVVIKNYGFHKKSHNFKPLEENRWEEIVGYRIYEIEPDINPATIYVDGIVRADDMSTLDLNKLANRPVPPFYSIDADWVWQLDNDVTYWFFHGDMILEINLQSDMGEHDSRITVFYWSYFDQSTHARAKKEAGWELTRGELDV